MLRAWARVVKVSVQEVVAPVRTFLRSSCTRRRRRLSRIHFEELLVFQKKPAANAVSFCPPRSLLVPLQSRFYFSSIEHSAPSTTCGCSSVKDSAEPRCSTPSPFACCICGERSRCSTSSTDLSKLHWHVLPRSDFITQALSHCSRMSRPPDLRSSIFPTIPPAAVSSTPTSVIFTLSVPSCTCAPHQHEQPGEKRPLFAPNLPFSAPGVPGRRSRVFQVVVLFVKFKVHQLFRAAVEESRELTVVEVHSQVNRPVRSCPRRRHQIVVTPHRHADPVVSLLHHAVQDEGDAFLLIRVHGGEVLHGHFVMFVEHDRVGRVVIVQVERRGGGGCSRRRLRAWLESSCRSGSAGGSPRRRINRRCCCRGRRGRCGGHGSARVRST
mmetsp:Transcript_24726/g.62155  ORF Transcript_24726/g.62155 Transcript_24726/m.62155 type:complete len:382 (-) Transcript_24726:7578-8723(-)